MGNDTIKLEFGVYTKPLGTYQYIPWTSAHPPATKHALPGCELKRRLRLCTTGEKYRDTTTDWLHKFRNRGYPETVLQKALKENPFGSRDRHRATIKRRLTLQQIKEHSFSGKPNRETRRHDVLTVFLKGQYDPRTLHNRKSTRKYLEDYVNAKTNRETKAINAFSKDKNLLQTLNKGSGGLNPKPPSSENSEANALPEQRQSLKRKRDGDTETQKPRKHVCMSQENQT